MIFPNPIIKDIARVNSNTRTFFLNTSVRLYFCIMIYSYENENIKTKKENENFCLFCLIFDNVTLREKPNKTLMKYFRLFFS